MSLIINGVEIPPNGTVKYNNTDLKKIICNGVTVWEKIVFETKEFSYTGGMQSVVLPPGLYRLECWGAQGGGLEDGTGDLGGYACVYKYFPQQTTVYVCVGEQGHYYHGKQMPSGFIYPPASNDFTTMPPGGVASYNGGKFITKTYAYFLEGGIGGGCTHMALSNGVLENLSGRKSDVLVVAGGGGGGVKYNIDWNCNPTFTGWWWAKGGDGGGLTGDTGHLPHRYSVSAYQNQWGTYVGVGGGQTAPSPSGRDFDAPEYPTWVPRPLHQYGGFGYSGSTISGLFGGGGGGGWYGGKYGENANGSSTGGGGSSYIGGSVTTLTHGGIVYTNTTTKGQNSGHGKAKITYIAA